MGDANVLSTTTIAPEPLHASAIAFMSKILRVGLVGVSNQTSFVLGLNIFLKFFTSEKSEKSISIVVFGPNIFLKYLYVPPYTSSTHKTWSPIDKRFSRVTWADIPEFYANANFPCSIEAKLRSKARRVGFPHLE